MTGLLLEKEEERKKERKQVGQNSVLSMFLFGTLESTNVHLNQIGFFSVMSVVCMLV